MMEMRRSDRQVSAEEAWKILENAPCMTLAMQGAEGDPYAVTLSFVRMGSAVYFHSATEGYKLRSLAAHPRVCLTAVEAQHTLAEKFSVAYRSAVAFGTAFPVDAGEERTAALQGLCKKYAPHNPGGPAYAAGCTTAAVWKICIDGITGKVRGD